MTDISKQSNSVQQFRNFLAMLTEERVSQIISRQLLTCICQSISQMTHQNARPFCEASLDALQARAISFEEQGTEIILHIPSRIKGRATNFGARIFKEKLDGRQKFFLVGLSC